MFRTRYLTLLVTCFTLLCGSAGADLPRSKSTSARGVNSPVLNDMSLDGVWSVVSAEKGNEKLPEEITKDVKLTFRAGKLTLEILGEAQEATYKIDGTKRPMRLDLTHNGKTIEGIFVLRGDTLTLCIAEPDNPRPTAFASAGSEHTLMVLKRKR